MIRDFVSYVNANKLKTNMDEIKVRIFRKEVRRKEVESWSINSEKLKIVDDFKYLRYWFSTSGTPHKHILKMAKKAQIDTNAAWGVIKRANIVKLEKGLVVIKSGAIYGVEI